MNYFLRYIPNQTCLRTVFEMKWHHLASWWRPSLSWHWLAQHLAQEISLLCKLPITHHSDSLSHTKLPYDALENSYSPPRLSSSSSQPPWPHMHTLLIFQEENYNSLEDRLHSHLLQHPTLPQLLWILYHYVLQVLTQANSSPPKTRHEQ